MLPLNLPLLTTAAVLPLASVKADELHVPGDYPSIQGALDASSDDDLVLVAPGTYTENIVFPPRSIRLISTDGPASTFIDGGQNGQVVRFVTGCPKGTLIEGFTITNGLGGFGGGLVCEPDASPTIRGNHIVQNTATYDGGGIYPRPSNRVTIEKNLIGWNTANNQAGGLQAPSSDSIVRNNVLVGNSANYGGAFFARVESDVILVNCTIYGNSAPNGSVAAGDGGLHLLNCVLDGHAGARFSMYDGGDVLATYSTIPNSAGQPWFGEGCIDVAPRMSDPDSGDFRLRPTSPSLDAGHAGAEFADLDGTRNDQGHTGGPVGVLRSPAWYRVPSLPEPRHNATVTASGGRLYSLGGSTLAGRTRSVLVYDPSPDEWQQLPDYPGPEIRSAMSTTLDGFVYMLGGYLFDYAASDQVWRLDPASETWTERAPLPEPRLHASVQAVSGRIYVIGGRSHPAWQYHSTVLVYDPSLDRRKSEDPWTQLCSAEVPTPLGDNAGINFNGEIVTFGSYEPPHWERALHYSPSSGEWRTIEPSPMTTASSAVALAQGAFVLEKGTGKFWSWDPSQTLPAQTCSSGQGAITPIRPQPINGLDFRPLPAFPTDSPSTNLTALNGLIYTVGGAHPFTDECWVFEPEHTSQ